MALFAAGLHLVAHALGKALLFFAAGTVAQRYETRTLARIRGAAGALPLSGTALLLGGLALAGAPPSALFATELSILAAGFERGQALAACALLVCLALIFVGLLYHLGGMALGAPAAPSRRASRGAAGHRAGRRAPARGGRPGIDRAGATWRGLAAGDSCPGG